MTDSLPGILVIGGANLDVTGTTMSRLVAGQSNPGTVKSYAGGVGRNIAENLARLGFTCHFISAIGTDPGHRLILESCQQVGVNVDDLLVCPDFSTGTYLAIHNQHGALQAGVVDMAIIDQLTPETLQGRQTALNAHEHLVLDGNLSATTLNWIVDQYPGKTLYVDAVSPAKAPRLLALLPHVDVLKVNREEAEAILGLTAEDEKLAASLYDRGVKNVLLSQGAQGAILHNDQGSIHREALQGDHVSDTGAGDALFAGFIAARHLLEGADAQLEFAIGCASATMDSSYSVNPTLSVDSINRALPDHGNNGDSRR